MLAEFPGGFPVYLFKNILEVVAVVEPIFQGYVGDGIVCGKKRGARMLESYIVQVFLKAHACGLLEFSAEIADIDKNEYGLKKGMIVTANPYYNCGHCYSCSHGIVNACMDNQTLGCQRDGAFCEYISIPIERVYDGKGIPAKVLAAIEPFCISYHGVSRANVKKEIKYL